MKIALGMVAFGAVLALLMYWSLETLPAVQSTWVHP